MAYINLQRQREIRDRRQVAVLTKLRPDMNLPGEFEAGPVLTCEQGQRLEWPGLDARAQLHWFGVQASEPLCARCWQASECPREFAFAPERHEILHGSIPLSSRVAQVLLTRARPWIEASQAQEKNQLGLSPIFLNRLRLAWSVGLLAGAGVVPGRRSARQARSTLPRADLPWPRRVTVPRSDRCSSQPLAQSSGSATPFTQPCSHQVAALG